MLLLLAIGAALPVCTHGTASKVNTFIAGRAFDSPEILGMVLHRNRSYATPIEGPPFALSYPTYEAINFQDETEASIQGNPGSTLQEYDTVHSILFDCYENQGTEVCQRTVVSFALSLSFAVAAVRTDVWQVTAYSNHAATNTSSAL